jgi:hypothetical protein
MSVNITELKEDDKIYTLYIPLKYRKALEVTLPIEGTGILDILQATEPDIYKNLMENCHNKVPENFMFLGREDNIFVYSICKNLIKQAEQHAEDELGKIIKVNRVIVCDIEKSQLSDNEQLHMPGFLKKWKKKDGEEVIFEHFPSILNL